MLKLNIGLSKKIGQPDFGSLGATCHVEVELDSSLIQQDLVAFHRHVRDAYVACSQAVNDELARQQVRDVKTVENRPSQSHAPSSSGRPTAWQASNGNGSNGNGNSHSPSQKQRDYINQLARQIKGLGVRRTETLCDRMFDKPLTDLSSFEASALIDQLKAIKGGDLDLADVLGEEAVA